MSISKSKKNTKSYKDIPYLSFRWKFIGIICVLALVVNLLLATITYQHLKKLLDQQQIINIEKNATILLNNSRQRLIEVAQAIAMAAQTTSRENQNSIKQYLSNNWDIHQIEWGLSSLVVYAEEPLILGDFEDNNIIKAMVTEAKSSFRPASKVLCDKSCHIFAVIPIRFFDGSFHIMLISTTMADFTIDLALQNDIGAALLRTNSGQPFNYRSLWNYSIEGITNNGNYSELLSKLSTMSEAEVDIENGYSLGLNSATGQDKAYVYFHTIAIEGTNESNRSLLLIMTDITESRKVTFDIVTQTIALSSIATLLALILLCFSIQGPMQRIKRQAELLPLLAKKQYSVVRKALKKSYQRCFTHDELDILAETSIELSEQLELMQDEIDNRTNELENMALYDVLTGLANRRFFSDNLDTIIEDSKKNHERFAVIFIDLDNFKRINDSMGHDVGDELLIEVSRRLTESVRQTDIVARLGGDEFTIISPQVGKINNIKIMLDKLVANFQKPMLLSNNEILVTPSIGVSLGPDNGLEASELMRCADMAMYEAKQSGKNCYHFFTEEMNDIVQKELKLEHELSEGIDSSQFRLFYQPILSLATGKIIALEGLLRWLHPQKGLLAPAAFIDMLENSGMIVSLGEQIFHLACLDKKYLNSIGCEAIKISFNISAKQFKDPLLLDKLQNAMSNTGTEPGDFKIEITENTLMEDIEKQAKLMDILRGMGFHIAIDDFGTGYSSLSYLKQLPVDVLKIDRSFIMDIPQNQDDIEIVSAVTAMAHKLNLQVVAEGIENLAQESFLKKIGCDFGQGYLYQKPMPLQDMVIYLQESQSTNGAVFGIRHLEQKKHSNFINWPE
ncbi:MAG: EAL domain-containing protein [Pseudomonadales bacterium]|nr:EAL domain-containing protein [Pseudomonadales bacterium]